LRITGEFCVAKLQRNPFADCAMSRSMVRGLTSAR
jgi:hypothetical protein